MLSLRVLLLLLMCIASTAVACNVPGQSVEGRERYHTDGGTTLDVQDDAPDTGLVEPDLDETAQDTTAADADAAVDAGDVDVGDTDADATAAPDTHEGQDTAPDTPDLGCHPELGAIVGQFCTPGGVIDVSVEFTDCNNQPWTVEDTTSVDKRFELAALPPATYEVQLRTGSYTTVISDVEVYAGEETALYSKFDLCPPRTRIAVFTGAYDHVEAVLDGRGVVYALYEGDTEISPWPRLPDLLSDRGALADYETLIINSGDWAPLFAEGIDADPMRARVKNLRDLVLGGRNLFVTDWAWLWVEAAFPEAIEFVGDPDVEGQAVPGLTLAPAVGAMASVPVVVDDPVLAEAIGRDTLTLSMSRDVWVVPVAAHPDARVLVRAPQVTTYAEPALRTDVPMLVAWQPTAASGTVYFSAAGLAFLDTITAEQIVHRVIFDETSP